MKDLKCPPSPYSFRIGLRFLFPVQRYNIGRPLWGHQVHGCQTLLLTDLRYLSQGRFSEIIRPLSSVINTINYLLAPCRISARRYRKKEDVDKGAMRERTLPHDVFDDRLGAVNRKGRRHPDISGRGRWPCSSHQDGFLSGCRARKKGHDSESIIQRNIHNQDASPGKVVNEFVEFNAAED